MQPLSTPQRVPTASLLGLALGLLLGCNASSVPPEDPPREGPQVVKPAAATAPARSTPPPPKRIRQETRPAGPGPDGELSARAAIDLVWSAVEQSLDYGPVVAVWIFDASPSARNLATQVSGRLKRHYAARATAQPEGSGAADASLASLVAQVGSEVRFVTAQPTSDDQQVQAALDQLDVDKSGQERLFAAVAEALERTVPLRAQGEAKIIVTLVTDEAGDDGDRVESLVEIVQRESVPVFVLGSPAPLGRTAATTPLAERSEGPPPSPDWLAVRHGPESRYPEFVAFESLGESADLNLMDSGFGPFALEWLCRASGGTFLAIRPKANTQAFALLSDSWPNASARRFPREVMQLYAPDYVSEANYQQLLDTSAALRALYEAAQGGPLPLLGTPQLEFSRSNEAQLSGALNKAQQEPARLAPQIHTRYELLKKGEAERDKILSRRWQAAYDLALGRTALAKVRVEGYNAMLAKLKRGLAPQNADSTTWILMPAEQLGDSSLERLARQARELLSRVVQEHPDTPWAAVAQRELDQPWGWVWTER